MDILNKNYWNFIGIVFFVLLLFSIPIILFTSGCSRRGYEIIKTDGDKMLVQEWKGTDTTLVLVKVPTEIRGKYLNHRLVRYQRGYGHDYYPVIYVLCGNDTLILNGDNNDIPFNARTQCRIIEAFNPGDSILIRRQYYPYPQRDDIEYIFK